MTSSKLDIEFEDEKETGESDGETLSGSDMTSSKLDIEFEDEEEVKRREEEAKRRDTVEEVDIDFVIHDSTSSTPIGVLNIHQGTVPEKNEGRPPPRPSPSQRKLSLLEQHYRRAKLLERKVHGLVNKVAAKAPHIENELTIIKTLVSNNAKLSRPPKKKAVKKAS